MFFLQFKLLLFVGILFCSAHCSAYPRLFGGESSGVGGCFVLMAEPVSFLYSPIAIGDIKETTLGTAFDNKFLVKGLSTSAVVIAVPITQNFISALGYSRFGSSVYAVNHFAVGGSKSLTEYIELGVRFDFHSETYGNDDRSILKYSAAIAAKYKFSNDLIAAVLVNEPFSYINNKPPVKPYSDRSLHIGLSKKSQKLQLGISVDMPAAYQPEVTIGIIYFSGLKFKLFSGVSTGPNVFSFGFGYSNDRWAFSTSSSYHPHIGFSPSTSLIFSFDKSDN